VITVEDKEGIALVRLGHGKVNALDLELLEAIASTFTALADARAIVLTGAGRAFSAGVDLRRIVDGGPAYVAEFVPALSRAFHAVFDCPRPVVGAVNGHAIAGGCILALACDFTLMSAGSIGLTELLVGVPFPASAFEIAWWAVGAPIAPLIMTSRTLPPDEARASGLVHEVVTPDALIDAALAHATRLGAVPVRAFAMTKQQLRRDARLRIRETEASDSDVTAVWQAPETIAGIADYLDSLAR
jgi:enoyl-CoA hydratase